MEAERAEKAETLLALVTLLLLTVAPLAAAQASPRDTVLVVYHVTPDPRAGTADADPFSASSAAPDATLAASLPATRVDGVLDAAGAPEGDPSNPAAHTRELQRLLDERRATGAPAEIDITGNATTVSAAIRAAPGANVTRVIVHGMALRDGAVAKGRVERDLAIGTLAPTDADLSRGDATFARDLPPDANAVAVWVTLAADAGTHRAGEVVQAASWRIGGPDVHRATKGILVEHLTATWCDACAPSDAAVAIEAGAPPGVLAQGSYLVAPTTWTLAGLAAGAAGAFALWRRR